MAFNVNEMLIDRVRYVTAHDIETDEQLFMLSELEDASLNTSAEGEDITDAVGALITTIYRSKQAEFSATNSLFSLNLAAAQFGAEKEVATDEKKIVDYTYEMLEIENGKVTLKHEPVMVKVVVDGEEKEVSSVKYIYAVENGVASTSYKAGVAASDTEFLISGKEITVPTGLTGKVFVEYQYESTNAVRVVNKASEFPKVCSAIIYVIFRDVCTEELIAGKILCKKCKLDPSSVEIALTSTGKHPFTFKIQKDFCSSEDELFTFIVSDEDEDEE